MNRSIQKAAILLQITKMFLVPDKAVTCKLRREKSLLAHLWILMDVILSDRPQDLVIGDFVLSPLSLMSIESELPLQFFVRCVLSQ